MSFTERSLIFFAFGIREDESIKCDLCTVHCFTCHLWSLRWGDGEAGPALTQGGVLQDV